MTGDTHIKLKWPRLLSTKPVSLVVFVALVQRLGTAEPSVRAGAVGRIS